MSMAVSAQTASMPSLAPPADSLKGLSLETYYRQHLSAFKQWYGAGLRWFVIGNNMVFVFPANDFYGDTDEGVALRNKAILHALAQWMRPVPKNWVRLLGFREGLSSTQADRVLAVQDAKTLAQYFGDQGIDARMIYTNGFVETLSERSARSLHGQSSRANRIEMVVSILPTDTALR